jgi:hypothetical protein
MSRPRKDRDLARDDPFPRTVHRVIVFTLPVKPLGDAQPWAPRAFLEDDDDDEDEDDKKPLTRWSAL